VLVNYAKAKGNEIWHLSGQIVDSVKERFGIELEREVQVW
jgi:UDP-N-acetylmuramate dehydrogenase